MLAAYLFGYNFFADLCRTNCCARHGHQVDSILGQLELGDPQLQAKALRLGGDILWRLHREDEGVRSYLRCLGVVSDAEKLRDATQEGR